jgi:hypothetical protein
VSISRAAADRIVTDVVLERLGRPDAAQLFGRVVDSSAVDRQLNELRHRRDEIADLLADGLLSGAAARPRLLEISERLVELETTHAASEVSPTELADPTAAWESWSVPQRREVLRVLFSGLTLKHVGNRNM